MARRRTRRIPHPALPPAEPFEQPTMRGAQEDHLNRFDKPLAPGVRIETKFPGYPRTGHQYHSAYVEDHPERDFPVPDGERESGFRADPFDNLRRRAREG